MKEKYSYGNECGKWMMFFNIGPQLDEKWAEARKLYKFIFKINKKKCEIGYLCI
jgi:hypothetical protein